MTIRDRRLTRLASNIAAKSRDLRSIVTEFGGQLVSLALKEESVMREPIIDAAFSHRQHLRSGIWGRVIQL